MSRYPADFLHGTLDTLILKTLAGGAHARLRHRQVD